ncbi:hypothetical protein ACP_1381 [Acidobacterium capsulatum ATCC 51196]|uniref:Uncharacterized protein n=1 Tax=Acidobacterium capsulatum (strain ATCC 51196 / DSM 11244 / BCRC 80197 / JCM 7670 / NBRC 15755 / NCIMB 13165 / 161) TaxID=240015 RepID=C1F5X4_ACIC5|nr:hypothetical protein ACP_1381 [Acidobacterium capsulatum ATCC 51196]
MLNLGPVFSQSFGCAIQARFWLEWVFPFLNQTGQGCATIAQQGRPTILTEGYGL